MAALFDWLELRGDHPGPLFHPTVKGGRISPRRMSDQAVLDILRQRGEQAQVSAFSPHDFRRTFISNLLDAGADISRPNDSEAVANRHTKAEMLMNPRFH